MQLGKLTGALLTSLMVCANASNAEYKVEVVNFVSSSFTEPNYSDALTVVVNDTEVSVCHKRTEVVAPRGEQREFEITTYQSKNTGAAKKLLEEIETKLRELPQEQSALNNDFYNMNALLVFQHDGFNWSNKFTALSEDTDQQNEQEEDLKAPLRLEFGEIISSLESMLEGEGYGWTKSHDSSVAADGMPFSPEFGKEYLGF